MRRLVRFLPVLFLLPLPACSQTTENPTSIASFTAAAIGNSHQDGRACVQPFAWSAAVAPDGTVAVAGFNIDSGNGCYLLRDGAFVGAAVRGGQVMGTVVAANGTYVYYSAVMKHTSAFTLSPPEGMQWLGISRFLLATGAPAPDDRTFGQGDDWQFFPVVRTSASNSVQQFSAIAADEAYVYCQSPFTDELIVSKVSNNQIAYRWSLPRGSGPMAAAGGYVWIATGDTVRCYTPQGVVQPGAIRTTALAMGTDASDGELMVADANHVITWYTPTPTAPATGKKFGMPGGLYGGAIPGRIGDGHFGNMLGIGCAKNGSLHVGWNDRVGTVAFNTTYESCAGNSVTTRLSSLIAYDYGADEATMTRSGLDAYSTTSHISIDVSSGTPAWKWLGQSVDSRQPIDPRYKTSTQGRYKTFRLNGNLFIAALSTHVFVFRAQPSSELSIPVAMIASGTMRSGRGVWPDNQPRHSTTDYNGPWIWLRNSNSSPWDYTRFDAAGNLNIPPGCDSTCDDNGNVWIARPNGLVTYYPCAVAPNGDPNYSQATASSFRAPGLTTLCRIAWVGNNRLLVTGMTAADKLGYARGGVLQGLPADLGRTMMLLDANTHAIIWRAPTAGYNTDDGPLLSMAVAGHTIFFGHMKTSKILAYSLNTGLPLENNVILPGRPQALGGWIDRFQSMSATELPNGQILLTVENVLNSASIGILVTVR